MLIKNKQSFTWLTLESYARQFNILDKSTWHRTEWMILARELILCISFSSSFKSSPEPPKETKSTLLRMITSYKKKPNLCVIGTLCINITNKVKLEKKRENNLSNYKLHVHAYSKTIIQKYAHLFMNLHMAGCQITIEERRIKWELPQMLFEEMLQETKMNSEAHWADNEGFWHPQPAQAAICWGSWRQRRRNCGKL